MPFALPSLILRQLFHTSAPFRPLPWDRWVPEGGVSRVIGANLRLARIAWEGRNLLSRRAALPPACLQGQGYNMYSAEGAGGVRQGDAAGGGAGGQEPATDALGFRLGAGGGVSASLFY